MKPSIKSLSEELEKVKAEIKELPALKKKINELQELVEKLLGKGDIQTDEVKSIKCPKCEQTFACKKSLKSHLVDNHAFISKCKLCDKTFSKNCELEIHIKHEHESPAVFPCEVCNKTFVLKWRLEMHKRNHTSEQKQRRKCHYFNNKMVCPFSELGCMFDHELSEKCKFDQRCSMKLCPYQHSESELSLFNLKEKQKADEQASLFECAVCDFKGKDYCEFYTHIESSHEEEENDQEETLE